MEDLVKVDGNNGRRSIGALLRDLAEGSATLMRSEVRLAQIEIGTAVAGLSRGTALVATGGVLAFLGSLSLIAGVVLLIGDQWLPGNLYWVAALIVFVIASAVAMWLAKRGIA